uniref:Uncharacterized protein n=1 Tax=Ananas comosus var. bracteatus TaxID=296719 RepID=A0A6V7NPI4_ANACO|nr:unnamed protein product [Ananas comosus var. bracteatus]
MMLQSLQKSPSTVQSVHCSVWAIFTQKDRSLPAWDRSLGSSRKASVREPVSPRMGPVSPRIVTLGDRSHPPGTGCLKSCCNTVPRGPVSSIRDRSPRVKTLRTCQNSRDRTFRSEYHLRPSTKCGKARNPYQTLEPRNLHRNSVREVNSRNLRIRLRLELTDCRVCKLRKVRR